MAVIKNQKTGMWECVLTIRTGPESENRRPRGALQRKAKPGMGTEFQIEGRKHKPKNKNLFMEMYRLRTQARMIAEEVVLHDVVNCFH